MPVGPVVAAFRVPVVQMMRNPAAGEHLGHSVGGAAILPRTTAGHESDVATRVLIEKPGVILVRQLVDWAYRLPPSERGLVKYLERLLCLYVNHV